MTISNDYLRCRIYHRIVSPKRINVGRYFLDIDGAVILCPIFALIIQRRKKIFYSLAAVHMGMTFLL